MPPERYRPVPFRPPQKQSDDAIIIEFKVQEEDEKELADTVQEALRQIADTGVVYYDYSFDERFRENLQYFSDSDHLNPEGAAYFMSILWNELPELKRFQ